MHDKVTGHMQALLYDPTLMMGEEGADGLLVGLQIRLPLVMKQRMKG